LIEVAREVINTHKESGNRKQWYDATLFELYMKSKSYKDASRLSKIPTMTIHHAVRRMKVIITENIELTANGKKK
jgi:hypothetical protein